jgi:hypothetical protein
MTSRTSSCLQGLEMDVKIDNTISNLKAVNNLESIDMGDTSVQVMQLGILFVNFLVA